MTEEIFELTKVVRDGGNLLADERRVGCRYRPHIVVDGMPASFYYADDSGRVLLTSKVVNVLHTEYQIVMATANTVYFFRRVIE